MKYLIISASVILISALGFIALKDNPEKTLEKFWQYSLEGNFDEAAKYTLKECEVAIVTTTSGRGCGTGRDADGKLTDSTSKESIFKDQIKLEKIIEKNSETYFMGFVVATTKNNIKGSDYIVCLATAETDYSWRVSSVTPNSLRDYENGRDLTNKEAIAKNCFENNTVIEDSIKKAKQIEAELNANKAATESNANRK